MNQSTNQAAEIGVTHYLQSVPELSGISIIAHSDIAEAPEHPSIIVRCEQSTRSDEHPPEMRVKTANITASLYYDYEDEPTDFPAFQAAATAMECYLEDATALQEIYNHDPAANPDPRPVTGFHLHYIDEFQTDSDTDDMTWQFGVGMSLILEQVSEV